jgi:hypothetical protein
VPVRRRSLRRQFVQEGKVPDLDRAFRWKRPRDRGRGCHETVALASGERLEQPEPQSLAELVRLVDLRARVILVDVVDDLRAGLLQQKRNRHELRLMEVVDVRADPPGRAPHAPQPVHDPHRPQAAGWLEAVEDDAIPRPAALGRDEMDLVPGPGERTALLGEDAHVVWEMQAREVRDTHESPR